MSLNSWDPFEIGARAREPPVSNRLLKNSSLPRLLKRVQMQGAVTHPDGWVPAAGYPPQVGHSRWAFFSSLLSAQRHVVAFQPPCYRNGSVSLTPRESFVTLPPTNLASLLLRSRGCWPEEAND